MPSASFVVAVVVVVVVVVVANLPGPSKLYDVIASRSVAVGTQNAQCHTAVCIYRPT